MPQKIKKYYFTIGNFLISFVLLLTFALSKYSDFQNYRLELVEKRTTLEDQQEYFKDLNFFQAELKKYEPELTKINSSLPATPSAPAMLDYFQKVASQNGLIISDIDFQETILVLERPYLLKKEIAIIVESPYSSFRKFLSDIEKNSRLIQVESLSFSLPEKGDIFTFNLATSINFLPEVKPVSTPEESTFEEF